MSVVKTGVLTVLSWVAVGPVAQADALMKWTNWMPARRNGQAPDVTVLSAIPDFSTPTVSSSSPPPLPVLPPTITAPTIQAPTLTSTTSPAAPPSSPPPPSPTSAPATSPATADASLNFGSGPFPEADTLTTGGAQAWYLSPSVQHVFGGTPNPQQQNDFENLVLQDVQKTFSLSGLTPSISIDPSVHANHILSVVSNTSYGPNPGAIGITDVGADGFGFIDKLSYAKSVQELAWAVAHNLSHELMHTFGVAVHHDSTGTYLDAATASWDLLTDPNAKFSPAAVQDIAAHDYGRNPDGTKAIGTQEIDGDQILTVPTPEPATIVLWALAGLGLCVSCRRRTPIRSAA